MGTTPHHPQPAGLREMKTGLSRALPFAGQVPVAKEEAEKLLSND